MKWRTTDDLTIKTNSHDLIRVLISNHSPIKLQFIWINLAVNIFNLILIAVVTSFGCRVLLR